MYLGKTGVFLCSCGKDLNINFRKLANEVKKLEDIEVVEKVDYLCRDDGLAYIVDDFRRKELESILIAACSSKNKVFEKVVEDLGLDPIALEIVNIRENCGWVHDNRADSTKKAALLIKSAFDKEVYFPDRIDVNAGYDVLVMGNVEGLRVASELSRFGADVQVLTEEGYIKKDCSLCLDSQLCDPSHRECLYGLEDVVVHTNSSITDIEGEIGNFAIGFEKSKSIDAGLCLACGKCVEVCEKGAISSPPDAVSRTYVIDVEKCDDCKACLEACPSYAINLEDQTGVINAGQIISFSDIPPKEGIYLCEGETKLDLYKNSQSAILRAIPYMEGIKKDKVIKSEPDKCANKWLREKKLDIEGCTLCSDACPYGAISSGIVDEIQCQDCGVCISACPLGVIRWTDHPCAEIMGEIERMLETNIKPKVLMFSCEGCGNATLKAVGENRIAYPVVIPITVPCLGSVSDIHILRAFDLGADGVLLNGCRGGECRHKNGVKAAAKGVAFIKKLFKALGIGSDRVKMLQGDPEKPKRFADNIAKFTKNLEDLKSTPLKKKEPVDIESIMRDTEDREKTERDLLHAFISSFSEKTGIRTGLIKGDFPFGDVSIDENRCTICGACGSQCSTGGFTAEGKVLPIVAFTHTYCIACGICEEVCPEKAIKLRKQIDLERFIAAQKEEIKVKLINCERCGKPIMASTAFNKLTGSLEEEELELPRLCQDCMDRMNILSLLDIEDSEDVRIFHQGRAPWE
ncbi:MAG: hydrogenase iron-sulfur subunit [Candidatus Hydrothermarchaeales archaeon]